MRSFFRSKLAEKQVQPEQQQMLDIKTVLPPPPNICLRRPPPHKSQNQFYITEDAIPKQIKRILHEVESNDSLNVLDMLILLRKGKQLAKHSKDKLSNGIIYCYLGIMYYKTGLLEQAFQQLLMAEATVKEHIEIKKLSIHTHLSQTEASYSNLSLQSKWIKIRAKIHLQLCILLSQIERHQLALKHAQLANKLFYETLINYFLIARGSILNKQLHNLHYLKNNNLVSLIQKLLSIMNDMKFQYLSKHKMMQISTQNLVAETCKFQQNVPNIELFINQIKVKSKQMLNSKILNQVQMEILKKQDYKESNEITYVQFLEIVLLLSVSFYCLSTQSRFIEKDSAKESFINNDIPQSENWLSIALEIAYTFLPAEAPILGQIYSVHDKFYGLDKQPIPQDEQITGQVKFLKQMRKATSLYDKKANLFFAPILVRKNQTPTFSPQKHSREQSKQIKMRSLTIDISHHQSKQKSKRSSLQKIYKRNNKRLSKIKLSSSENKNRTSPLSFTLQDTRPVSTDLGFQKLARLTNNKMNIQINNNINVVINNQKLFDDKVLSSDFVSTQPSSFHDTRKVIVKLISNTTKDSLNRRNIYHSKRKPIVAQDIQLSEI